MDKRIDIEECSNENCRVNVSLKQIVVALQNLSEKLEESEKDTKAGFAKFERKQDQIVEILGEWKAITTELKNLKEFQQRMEQEIIRDQNGLREDKTAIWNRINELERTKQNVSDAKEQKGWFWGLIILVLTILSNFVIDLIKKAMVFK